MAEETKKPESEEKEIDLLDLIKKLWAQRKKLIIWSAVGAVIGLVIAFSIPRQYTTSVKLAPEINDGKSAGGGLSALASIAGFSTSSGSGTDAVNPILYPDVVASIPFLTDLFDVNVPLKGQSGEKERIITVKEYLTIETKGPWWGAIKKAPRKLVDLFRKKETVSSDHTLNTFQLTEGESQLYEALKNSIVAKIDQKTSIVTISVTMQDPLVSAVLADTVVNRLQEYITEYRTNKARQDLAYAEKLNREAKEEYYNAQQRYADYLDHNQGIAFRSAQTVRERLENEATLAFNLYNQTSQHVQQAQAKVQETTPVYAIISPATVPLIPSAPRKFLILVAFTFLGFAACAGKILFIDPIRQKSGE